MNTTEANRRFNFNFGIKQTGADRPQDYRTGEKDARSSAACKPECCPCSSGLPSLRPSVLMPGFHNLYDSKGSHFSEWLCLNFC